MWAEGEVPEYLIIKPKDGFDYSGIFLGNKSYSLFS